MSDSNDTSAIDDKKDESTTNSNNLFTNIASFFTTVTFLVLIIVVYFSYGGLILYMCKLAQSNILPTNEKCYPYTDVKQNIEEIQTNIFTTFFNPPLSAKLSFPYNKYNSSNKILDMFRAYKDEPNSYFLTNYFISIIESLICFNYSSFNFILNLLNNIPEILVILFGPFIISIISTLLFLFDHLYIMYLWFAKMGWFFKQNINTDMTHKPIWRNVTILSPFDYCCALALIILFCVLFWLLVSTLPLLPSFTMLWCMFTLMTYNSKMNDINTNAFSIIQDIFKHYKVTIMYIFSFFVVVSAFTSMGTIPGLFSILTLILIYFGIISINIFQPVGTGDLSPVVSNEQANKSCKSSDNISYKKHGLLYTLIFGQKGGNVINELKNVSKKLNNI